MKKTILELTISFLIGSFLGAVSLLYQSSKDFFFAIFPLWLFYGMFYQSVIIGVYLILRIVFDFLKITILNPFLMIGVIDLIIRSQDFFSKHNNITTLGDFLLFMPALSLIFIGYGYYFWEKQKQI